MDLDLLASKQKGWNQETSCHSIQYRSPIAGSSASQDRSFSVLTPKDIRYANTQRPTNNHLGEPDRLWPSWPSMDLKVTIASSAACKVKKKIYELQGRNITFKLYPIKKQNYCIQSRKTHYRLKPHIQIEYIVSTPNAFPVFRCSCPCFEVQLQFYPHFFNYVILPFIFHKSLRFCPWSLHICPVLTRWLWVKLH